MSELTPLETLYDLDGGQTLPLPIELATLYGPVQFPFHPGRPYVIANFVSTLDGVVALGAGHEGGKEISGYDEHDRLVMGLLRAVADAVVVGAGTLRSLPHNLWTAEQSTPAFAGSLKLLRQSLGKSEPPLNVIVTQRGELDLQAPVFHSDTVRALIVTSAEGAVKLAGRTLPPSVRLAPTESKGSLSAREIVDAVNRACPAPNGLILVEGGPQLMAVFFQERVLDEFFLTLAPQVAGRDEKTPRPGFVDGQLFAPERPLWGALAGVKKNASHLFLRYVFDTQNR